VNCKTLGMKRARRFFLHVLSFVVSTRNLLKDLNQCIDIRLVAVTSKAGPNHAGHFGFVSGNHARREICVFLRRNFQHLFDIWVRAEAAVPHSNTGLGADDRGNERVVHPVDVNATTPTLSSNFFVGPYN